MARSKLFNNFNIPQSSLCDDILLDQIRAVDKTRLVKRAGAIAPSTLSTMLATLGEIFAE
ncbi:MAG: type II toxin-antitoxin system PemK/MazF family toxin [Terracidiphilus sp.]